MVNHCHGIVTAVAIASAFTAVVARPPQQMAGAFAFTKELVNKCQGKWAVSKDTVERMQRNRGELPDAGSTQQRCFQECVAKEMGLINEGGGVAADKIVSMLERGLQMASRASRDKFRFTLDAQAVRRDLKDCEFKGEDVECINSHETMKCLRTLGTPENMKRYISTES